MSIRNIILSIFYMLKMILQNYFVYKNVVYKSTWKQKFSYEAWHVLFGHIKFESIF
jgi:hypothetical protein